MTKTTQEKKLSLSGSNPAKNPSATISLEKNKKFSSAFITDKDKSIQQNKFFSYGIKKGNFCYDKIFSTFDEIINEDFYFDNYALVEKKSEYYKLMFDFDFKEKNEGYDKYKDKIEEISIYIINMIINQLKYVQ